MSFRSIRRPPMSYAAEFLQPILPELAVVLLSSRMNGLCSQTPPATSGLSLDKAHANNGSCRRPYTGLALSFGNSNHRQATTAHLPVASHGFRLSHPVPEQ